MTCSQSEKSKEFVLNKSFITIQIAAWIDRLSVLDAALHIETDLKTAFKPEVLTIADKLSNPQNGNLFIEIPNGIIQCK